MRQKRSLKLKQILNRAYNFGAGPAMLPLEVLQEAQAEFLDWQGRGLSILEVGHRTQEFMALLSSAEHNLRRLLSISDDYHVLFLGGAARLQFSMIPMNFIKPGQTAAYTVTGVWSEMAFEEAKRVKSAYAMPKSADREFQDNTAYWYYTPNETVNGIYTPKPENPAKMPLVADMTSCLLAEPIQVADYGLIFAGAQKNIANAGLTIVIVRKDWVDTIDDEHLATMLDYRTHSKHASLYATPPTFNCYLALKMFQWVEKKGGVDTLYKVNLKKAARLYDYIDASPYYHCPVVPDERSFLNLCFTTKDQTKDNLFCEQAEQHGLLSLRGHRIVGGLRASLYNAMPMEGVLALISFMDDFAKRELSHAKT